MEREPKTPLTFKEVDKILGKLSDTLSRTIHFPNSPETHKLVEESQQLRRQLIERGNFKNDKELDTAIEAYDKGLGAEVLKPSED